MLDWAVTFLVIALVSALFGFAGLVAAAVGIGKILFFIFFALFAISMAMQMIGSRRNLGSGQARSGERRSR